MLIVKRIMIYKLLGRILENGSGSITMSDPIECWTIYHHTNILKNHPDVLIPDSSQMS
jgi:hypothetical protein